MFLGARTMREEGLEKLRELFEEHRREYSKQRAAEPEAEVKRRRLEDIKDEAMKEDEPAKLDELYREYPAEYNK